MNIIKFLIISFLLLICSLEDVRKKQISIHLLIVMFVTVLVLSALQQNMMFINRAAGAGIGIILLAVGKISGEKIGAGDSIIIIMLGFLYGFLMTIELLGAALLASGIYSGILIVLHRIKTKDTIPFIPFILFGFMVCCFFS